MFVDDMHVRARKAVKQKAVEQWYRVYCIQAQVRMSETCAM